MSDLSCPHCETEIDEHEASRCLDAWVAEEVMGLCGHYLLMDVRGEDDGDYITWTCKFCEEEFRGLSFGKGWKNPHLHNYSTSIAAAWEVVERLVPEAGAEWAIGIFAVPSISSVMWGWQVELLKLVYPPNRGEGEIAARAETFQLAICRAALKATVLEGENEEDQTDRLRRRCV